MHGSARAYHAPAERLTDALVPEADAEDGDALVRARAVETAEAADGGEADPRLVGRAGTRREDQPLGLAALEVVDAHGIVAKDLHVGAELAEPLHEVVGEGVVIIDHEDLAFHRVAASATAASRPATAP